MTHTQKLDVFEYIFSISIPIFESDPEKSTDSVLGSQ